MTHEKFAGVTFNDLDPPGTGFQGHRSFPLSSTEIAPNIAHRAHILPERDYMTFRYLQTRLSVVCLGVVCLSLTFVRPTQGVEAFGNISSPLCTPAIRWPPCKILQTSSQGNPPSIGGVKRNRGSKIQRSWTCWTVQDTTSGTIND